MTDRINDKIKIVVDSILAECDYNKENFLVYRNVLDGVSRTAKALGYNNKTIRYIKEAKEVCFSLGHGATLK